MEFLFGFAFELVKIAILSSIYALIILIICKIAVRYHPGTWLDIISKKKRQFWTVTYIFISFGLLIYMFTSFGDHGLGDFSRIPIGHSKIVNEIDGNAYLENEKGDQQSIGKFTFDNNNLYAQTDSGVNENGGFLIWDLETDEWKNFDSRGTYLIEAKNKNYPLPDQFKDFEYYYDQYWNGWRFWLLP